MPTLSAVEVWWAWRANASQRLFGLLDDDERVRFYGYRRQQDRDRFLVGCALAKTLVARATGAAPEAIGFDRTCRDCGRPHGKPRLPHGHLNLSISHSGDVIGVAIAPAPGDVGLDVEEVRGIEVLPTVLSPEEAEAVAATDDPRRAFVVSWTRKEAASKAIGAGLRLEPREVVVSAPSDVPRLVAWPAAVAPTDVAVFDLAARPGYVAALAVLGPCSGVTELDGSPLLGR